MPASAGVAYRLVEGATVFFVGEAYLVAGGGDARSFANVTSIWLLPFIDHSHRQ